VATPGRRPSGTPSRPTGCRTRTMRCSTRSRWPAIARAPRPRRATRCVARSHETTPSPKPTTCSASSTATARIPNRPSCRSNGPSASPHARGGARRTRRSLS
jgi:hypothetical protein